MPLFENFDAVLAYTQCMYLSGLNMDFLEGLKTLRFWSSRTFEILSVLRNSNAVLVHVSLGHQSGLDFRKVLTAICFEPSRRTSHWSFVHVLEKLHSWHKPDSSKLDEWDEPIKERHKSLDKSSRRGWIYRGLVYLSYGSSHLSN